MPRLISHSRARGSAVMLLLVLVVLPWAAEAGPVTARFGFPLSYQDLEFGPDLGFARIQFGGFYANDDFLSGPAGDFEIADGILTLVSGPLVDVTPSGGDATYTHAAGGTLSLEFDLRLANEALHHGTFTAPLGVYVIQPSGIGGSTTGDLGPGVFDEATAHLLGISPFTALSPGGASFYLDTFDTYPNPYRVAKAFGYMEVTATAPEPAMWWLLTIGAVAAVFKFRGRPKA